MRALYLNATYARTLPQCQTCAHYTLMLHMSVLCLYLNATYERTISKCYRCAYYTSMLPMRTLYLDVTYYALTLSQCYKCAHYISILHIHAHTSMLHMRALYINAILVRTLPQCSRRCQGSSTPWTSAADTPVTPCTKTAK